MNTRLLNTPLPKDDPYGSLSMPVYHTAAYEFESAEAMELAFQGKVNEHTYSRISNPTVQYFENRVQTLTGALSVTALNSGMAAITNALITVAGSGKNIVSSRHLFGNTYSFLASTLAEFGVETRFTDLTDLSAVAQNIDENTCAVFLEIITNPQLEVVDIEAISKICKSNNVPLIADTTIIPFGYFHAQKFGIDIEVVSSTKYISGGATSIGGLIVDYGKFDWSVSRKLQPMFDLFGKGAFTAKLRKEIHRNLGAYMTPQVAYMQTLGLETLGLRYEKVASNALELAKALSGMEGITSVNHVGLTDNAFYQIAKKQFGEFTGAMFTIDLASKEACYQFMNKLQVIKRATNLFDNKTLAIHPSSTIYGTFTAEAKEKMHISDRTIRLSVGLEQVSDLIADIRQALK